MDRPPAPRRPIAGGHRRRARPAFTLVELLVVIGVVALLIGLLLPAMAMVLGRARAAACMSNARQIVTAINADSAANGGRLPENRTRLGDTATHITWRRRFADSGMGDATGLWVCPDLPGEPQSELGKFDNTTECVGDVPSTYALNGHLLWRENVVADEAVVSDASITRPSFTILLAESRAMYPDIRATNNLIAADMADGGLFGFWHAGRGTYAFQDGHAETIGLMQTGNPDCRWHDGRDLNEDLYHEQKAEEFGPHGHPDWEYLAHEVYLR